MISIQQRCESLMQGFAEPLPLPGGGATYARHRALMEFGRTDLALARVVEAHTDALAILAESNRPAPRRGLYGVWASEGPGNRVHAASTSDGTWSLSGTKQYCTGAPFLSSALITAQHDNQVLLFEVALNTPGIRVESSRWETPALEDTATVPVTFNEVEVSADALVGSADWYLSRPGFWHGAIGPAACWAGGAMALIDAATALNRKDAHSRAHVGALQAAAWAFDAVLDRAGREIDEDPTDSAGVARSRALKVRHLVERQCTEVMDRFGQATGPQLLAYDAQIARQHMALGLYIRQCHGERDLEAIPG